MSKPKLKFYVVWKGHKTGVFSHWDECKKQVHGFKNAEYKSFPTLHLANEALKKSSTEYIGNYYSILSPDELKKAGSPIMNSIAVDGAWDRETKDIEYKGVFTKTGELLFRKGPFKDGTNNVAEFLAIV